jgi:hypothetical protein
MTGALTVAASVTTFNLYANADATYSIGTSSTRFKDAYFSGTVNATTFSGNLTGTFNGLQSWNFERTWYLGGSTDSKPFAVILAKAVNGTTAATGSFFAGRVIVRRGSSGAWHGQGVTHVNCGGNYTSNIGSFYQEEVGSGACTGTKLCLITYNSVQYICLYFTSTSQRFVSVIGNTTTNQGNISSTFDPILVKDVSSYTLTDLTTSTILKTNVTGNAVTATKLQNSRTIWGATFDGSADIPVTTTILANNIHSDASFGINGNTGVSVKVNNTVASSMYLTSTGVGIGTTAPAYKLDVAGTGRFTGTLNTYMPSTTWVGGATTHGISFGAGGYLSSSNYQSFLGIRSSSGNSVSYGGLGDDIGFFGYGIDRISNATNGTDWKTYWNTKTGHLTHTYTLTVGQTITTYKNLVTPQLNGIPVSSSGSSLIIDGDIICTGDVVAQGSVSSAASADVQALKDDIEVLTLSTTSLAAENEEKKAENARLTAEIENLKSAYNTVTEKLESLTKLFKS